MRPDHSPYDTKLQAILAAAARVFAEKGYHNASIRDVSRASGVSLSGLYHYFQSKEDLLFQIQENVLETLLGVVEARLEGLTDPAERLRSLMHAYLSYFVTNMEAMRVLSHEADSLGGKYVERINRMKRRFMDIASDILADLKPDSEADPRVAIFSLFGMMNWIYTWYRPDRDVSVERLVTDMSRIYLDGFLVDEASRYAFSMEGSGGA